MTCDAAVTLIPLYFYGELPAEQEESLEAHLHECAPCAREVERQRLLRAALDRARAEPSELLLEDCRAELMAAIDGGAQPAPVYRPPARVKGAWRLFLEALAEPFGGFERWQQPVGAVALVALGFFSARFAGLAPGAAQVAALSGSPEVYSTVRSVQPDDAGRVRIAFDETRRREIDGRMEDPAIQRLLLAASLNITPPCAWLPSGCWSAPGSSEVRDALLNALLHDSNVGVRMKALEGLKPLAGDPQVRKSLRAPWFPTITRPSACRSSTCWWNSAMTLPWASSKVSCRKRITITCA